MSQASKRGWIGASGICAVVAAMLSLQLALTGDTSAELAALCLVLCMTIALIFHRYADGVRPGAGNR